MRDLYQKDERALPGNLLNRIYRFFLSYSKCSVFHYFATFLSPSVRNVSCEVRTELLYILLTQCIYVFRMVLTINSDCFPKQH
jgi:hypothetical protein